MVVRGAQVHLIPDAGHGGGEGHVFRERRVAGGGVGAADDPLVGTRDAAAAWICETEYAAQVQQVLGHAIEGSFIRLWRWHIGGRLGEVGRGLGRWVIAPRAGGIEIGGEGGADPLRN